MGQEEIRTLFASLKKEAARLKEDNERLERQNNQLGKEIQQLKDGEAQAQARSVAAKEEIASFHCYFAQFPKTLGPATLRSSVDAIRSDDPEAIILFSDSDGFCVATAGPAAQKKGIAANQLIKLSTEVAGGSGGGRPDMAQGRIKEPAKFPEIRKRIEETILNSGKG